MKKLTKQMTVAALGGFLNVVPSHAAITTIMHLPMGEDGSTGAGNIALDTSGNGYSMDTKEGVGSLTINTTTPAAPGSSSYTTFAGNAAMSTSLWRNDAATANLPADNFAMEFWVRHHSLAGHQRYVRSGTTGALTFSKLSNSPINLQRNGVASDSIHAMTPTVGQWYNIAIIRNNGISKLYVDGKEVVGDSFNGAPVWTGDYAIGQKSHTENQQYFVGDMDELRMFTFGVGDDPVAALSIHAVPEPSSAALLSLGGVSLILRRRK
ncbi:PEP-CTERM sorting domain-containing protein [Verrucomicrobiaceae bacterium N1E253]|uniref:PEP-CTERM sorting domain-containing protein n=1 Tax=Oceaniferula marina TaxID=2748318 RepID=A0A851GP64_9BACT|nr:LamG-like jellyroll fold domain-containing protein [Oceaniferula marina]NWK55934.1 PEP-CTERM sorting domain-containing protein [Oceaniferula marina]